MLDASIPAAQRAAIEAILLQTPRIWKNRLAETMVFLDAVYTVLVTGVPWRFIENHERHFKRFHRWSDRGLFEWIHALLLGVEHARHVSIDSTSCKVHRFARGARRSVEHHVGISRGGPNTKLHSAVDDHGMILRIIPSSGNCNDAPFAIPLLSGIRATVVLADRAYDSNKIRDFLTENGIEACIPSKKNRRVPIPHDVEMYKQRHIVECAFCRLKDFRRLSLRQDKSSGSFMGFAHFAAALINLRVMERRQLCP